MSDPIRIAYLVSRYPATNHTFILREIVALRSLGFDIQVITIRGADRPDAQMTDVEREERKRSQVVLPVGLHFVRAHIATLLRRPGGYLAGLLLALGLGGRNLRTAIYHFIYFLEAVTAGYMADRAGYRHVHSHFSSTVALIATRVFGFDLSVTIHGPDEFRDPVGFGLRKKVAASRFISTISHYARSQIMLTADPADWPKIEICRLGVDPEVFVPGPAREAADTFHVVCVGRLAAVKAQQILIAACARLAGNGWKLQLHLAGSGPDLDRLLDFTKTAGMNGNVVFEGPLNQDQVIALYRNSDVFALASFGEGVPVVLMEAMAMEIPCVATWVNGVPELIRHQEHGLLVAPSDAEGLAGEIEKLFRDAGLRRQLGQAARKQVMEVYNLQKNAEGLAEVFRRHTRA